MQRKECEVRKEYEVKKKARLWSVRTWHCNPLFLPWEPFVIYGCWEHEPYCALVVAYRK
jgi:hypothetical protein